MENVEKDFLNRLGYYHFVKGSMQFEHLMIFYLCPILLCRYILGTQKKNDIFKDFFEKLPFGILFNLFAK